VDGTVQALESTAGGLGHFYVAERSRVLYIRVPKAACTTILWGLLQWEGHDPSLMHRSRKPLLATPASVVHDVDLYPVPTLADVSPALRHEALTSPDWLRIAVVRNPYARLYSAWESKLLTRPPGNRRFNDIPELIEDERGIDVGASYRVFVSALSEQPDQWLTERHFRRQADLVPTAIIDDIEIIPTSGIADLFVRLSDRAGVSVQPRRSNEGLGIDGTSLLDDETAEKIVKLYAADFELTGVDPAAFTLGQPVFLNDVAQNLLRLAAERSIRTVQLSQAFQHAGAPRLAKVRRAARRLSRD
jgi:Sulfotransferase family